MYDQYFKWFDIPICFFPDEENLRQQYYQLSRSLHPDFYTLEEPSRREEILHKSSFNNEAYSTLSNKNRRVKYILEIHKLIDGDTSNSMDQEFLMEMMELNEDLMDASMEDHKEKFESLMKRVQKNMDMIEEESLSFMKEFDAGKNQHDNLLKIRDSFLKRQYILRILEKYRKFAHL